MQIERLTVLGKSDVSISMIMDVLESVNQFPNIEIINNLNIPIEHKFNNRNFVWKFVDEPIIGPFVLGVSNPISKKAVVEKFGDRLNYISLIHRTASISSTTTINKGCFINNHVSISAYSSLGNFVNVNRNASIGHHTIISDFVTINPNAAIAGHVLIGEGTKIGMGAMILDHVKIGRNCIIGAGSIVTKDVPDNVVAYGNPCKIIRENG